MSEAQAAEGHATKIPARRLAAYGAGAGVFEMLRAPGLAILPSLYAKDFGFALTTLSFAMLWLRLSDAVMDPLVGYLSDRTRTRWGGRKPWIFASIFVFVPACFLLYAPGESPTLWLFVVAYFFYFMGWAMFDIPYTAWGAEFATSYEERSRLSVWRNLCMNIGLLLTALLPLLPWMSSTAMSFEVTTVTAYAMAVLYPLVIVLMMAVVPSGEVVVSRRDSSVRDTVKAILGNAPMMIFLGVSLLSDLAVGIFSAMMFIFFDTYLGIGEYFALIFITAIAVSTLSLRLWQSVVERSSKRMLLLVCLVLGAVQGVSILVIDPGPLALPLFMAFLALYYIAAAGRDVALYAMIGDVVDYDTLNTGVNRAGQFTSAWMVLRKLAYALGPVIGFAVAGFLGYEPASPHTDASAIFGLKSANGYLPALLMALAAVLAFRFPITRERHRRIREQLEQRAAVIRGSES